MTCATWWRPEHGKRPARSAGLRRAATSSPRRTTGRASRHGGPRIERVAVRPAAFDSPPSLPAPQQPVWRATRRAGCFFVRRVRKISAYLRGSARSVGPEPCDTPAATHRGLAALPPCCVAARRPGCPEGLLPCGWLPGAYRVGCWLAGCHRGYPPGWHGILAARGVTAWLPSCDSACHFWLIPGYFSGVWPPNSAASLPDIKHAAT
jgi:hypothetical protein